MKFPKPHADQYKMLREEVMSLIKETRNVEVYVVGAVAALYAWLVKEGKSAPFAAFFIGVPLVLLGSAKAYALFKRIEEIAKYLKKIEEEFFTDPPALPGWERYLNNERIPLIGRAAIVFWIFMLAVSLVAPFLLYSK